MADARVPPGDSKRNRVKEFFHNALHKINKMKTALALWSRDPRSSRRSSNLPNPITISPLLVTPVEHTTPNTTARPTRPQVISPDPYDQGGIESLAILSPPSTLGVDDEVALLPVSSGPNRATAATPKPCRPEVWERLEATLTLLKNDTPAMHPLHSVARAVLDCLDIFEAGSSDKPHDTLANELNTMAMTLNEYATGLDSEPVDGTIAQLSGSIQDYATRLAHQQDRNGKGDVLGLAHDREEIANCCRQIESLSQQLQVSHQLIYDNKKSHRVTDSSRRQDLDYVEEARFNSSSATGLGRHGCIPGTCTDVLDLIKAWVLNPEGAKVLWMNGMPGMGKTAISYSLCEWLQGEQLLGASYFCSQTLSVSGNPKQLIPTIAYQLARYLPAFQAALCEVLEQPGDHSTLDSYLKFKKLLLEPIQEAKDQISRQPVIVIDGLDEYEDVDLIWKILDQLPGCLVDLPIKFFISGRPRSVIHSQTTSTAGWVPMVIDLHDVAPSIVKASINRYLTESLGNLDPTLSTEQIEQLTDLTQNLFIYASTIVEYILLPKTQGDPAARLQAILMTNSVTGLDTRPNEASKRLYAWYSAVLEQTQRSLSESELKNLQLVLWTVICAKGPITIKILAGLVGIEEDDVLTSLRWVRSILRVPEEGGHIVHHPSFANFIRNPPEPTVFHCKEAPHGQFLARRCFELMRSKLTFNICQLETSFTADSDVIDLEGRVDENISADLSYACQHWIYHLQQIAFSELTQEDVTLFEAMLSDFLSKRLLSWMEVLNLRGCIGVGAEILLSARSWLLKKNAWGDIQKSLTDARNFVARFASNSCSKSTPHIYVSALPSCPRSSSVYKNYWPRTQRLLNITGSTMNRTQDAVLSRWLANAPVSSLACSFDGTTIASGSHDGTIQLWNVHTGITIGKPIKGHGRSVCSIKFSHNGTRLASGFFDGTICLHNLTVTNTDRKLTGHRAPVFAIEFSLDSTRIASGSSDGTVCLWDTETGELINEPLRGELEVQSITFSPEGSHIVAMGARTTMVKDVWMFDAIIQSWNISDPGHPTTVRSFSGHDGPVFSVDLSPDGTCIATGGSDHTVRLWRADTGTLIGQPLQGHTSEVLAVKFSSNSTRIVSGSADRTVRIWEVSTGSPTGQSFEGHSNTVGAIMTMPDDTRIVSGSDDGTIRVWDADTVIPICGQVEGHSASVCSVVFSSNSDLIFSGSDDKTVRVW
ncbi:putative vegetative incompatibility protein HET-E-1, partial [Rhizoctonia solani 123E]